jgi:biotin operon repressor
MSVKVMGWVWDQSIEPAAKKMVLLAIADHADHDGDNAWPSVSRIARMVGINARNAQRYIRQLEEEGYLIIGQQRGGNMNTPDDRRPNLYRVVLRGGAGDTPESERGGAGDTPRGGAGDTLSVQGTIQTTGAKAPRKRDDLFNALVEVCQIDPSSMTSSARGAANRAIKELREVGATPEQVVQAASSYRSRYSEAAVTPSALAKHWPSLLEHAHPPRPIGPPCEACYGSGYVTDSEEDRTVKPCEACAKKD